MPIDAPIHVNEANLPRVLGVGLPVLLVFWQRECAPCDQLAPALNRLAKSTAGRALIAKINVADEPRLAQRYAIDRLPTIVFMKDGQEIGKALGAAPEVELVAWVEYLSGARSARPPIATGPSMPLPGAAAAPPSPSSASRSSAAASGEPGPSAHPVTVTDASFDQLIRTSQTPVLVDFWAEWCGPCKMIAPTVADLAREFAGRAWWASSTWTRTRGLRAVTA